jgi:hypothetical protein
MKYWNNGIICKRSPSSPGQEWNPGRLKFKRASPTEETKEKIRQANLGGTPHNKGKRGISEELSKQLSLSAKARAARGILPDNTGKDPWNKGLTKRTSKIVARYASKQAGQLRSGDYPTAEAHWNWKDSETYSKPFYHYSKAVWRLTKSNYNKNKTLINPQNLTRGRAGQVGAYQLDHKISVHYGFMNNIAPEVIGDINNLQLLTWEENLLKSNNVEFK